MNPDEVLVGTVAVLLAIVALAIGLGPWKQPYRLRSFANLSERFGKPVARGAWLAIAIASLTAGLAILTGKRPGYAIPAQSVELEQR